MKRIFLIFLYSALVLGQDSNQFTISGFVADQATGESLIGVNVYSDSLNLGTSTNSFGFYTLTLPSGLTELTFSFVGYEKINQKINLNINTELNVFLAVNAQMINEVIISDQVSNVKRTQSSVIQVPVEQITSMPAFLGEIDVLKSIQLLPGVQSGNEGSSGFYVRGGGADQNLILLDGVPVYNSSHLFGFFSIFNIDAIKNIKLTKGGFPARFGGRLSSVLEIDMKEGNMREFSGQASLGIISSKLTLETPIVKDKASCIISARRTYADVLLNALQPNNSNTNGGYYFYDLNTKINYKISNRDRIYLSGYFGDDIFNLDFNDENEGSNQDVFNFGLGWGNKTAAFRWNHLFNDKLFSNTTLTYSRYSFDIDQGFSSGDYNFGFGYLSGLRDFGYKLDFEFTPNVKHGIKFGFSYTYHDFFPGQLHLDYEYPNASFQPIDIDTVFKFSEDLQAHDSFLYIEDEIKVNQRLNINIGTHLALFGVRDSDYIKLQPRVSARYLLDQNWSIKFSYAEMQQNLHLLTNSSVGLPTDIWVPATDSVKPQHSRQFAFSLNTNFLDDILEASLEGYYKNMNDLIAYKEGASFFDAQGWESSIETGGEGRSYGIELFFQKKKGRTTGWLGYTLSWTDRRFNNINFGEWYPYKYDRRHDISIVLAHQFNDRIDCGLTWVYGTGNAITFPQATYWSNPGGPQDMYIENINYYGERNSTRMNAYHRLDFGINFHKQKKYYTRTLSLSIYNVYNRQNPFFVYLDEDADRTIARQVSLFPIIPSLTYGIIF